MPNYRNIADVLTPQAAPLRVRFGIVQSIEADRTMTLTIGGSTETIAGVRYAASMTPCPGKVVFCLTDGTDLFAVDHMAAADLALAPRAYRSTDQTITTATDTAVSFAGANSDTYVCWAAGQPTRLTAPITGRYQAVGWAKFADNATGFRAAWISKNGANEFGRGQVPAVSGSPTQLTVISPAFDLTKGEYVELYVRQNSGGDLALSRDSDAVPSLTLIYLGP